MHSRVQATNQTRACRHSCFQLRRCDSGYPQLQGCRGHSAVIRHQTSEARTELPHRREVNGVQRTKFGRQQRPSLEEYPVADSDQFEAGQDVVAPLNGSRAKRKQGPRHLCTRQRAHNERRTASQVSTQSGRLFLSNGELHNRRRIQIDRAVSAHRAAAAPGPPRALPCRPARAVDWGDRQGGEQPVSRRQRS